MTKNYLARIPERSKGTVSRAVAYASWVRIPLRAYYKIVRKDKKLIASLAQSAEHPPLKRRVAGSSPAGGYIYKIVRDDLKLICSTAKHTTNISDF